MNPRSSTLLLASTLASLAGCSGVSLESKRDPTFKPSASSPVRVAVLPFHDNSGGTSPLLYPLLPFIWLADVITLQVPEATPDPAKGAETLHALMIARLRGSSLNVVDPGTVRTTLGHAGLWEKAHEIDPREVGRLLGVDAVLYGELVSWGPRYYVFESHTVVEASIRLRSAMDGSDLFTGRAAVTDASGLSGGPTGYISLAATPLAALGTGPYRRLAIDWNEALGGVLTGGWDSGAAAAATPAPAVTNVAVVRPPENGYKAGDVIEVLATGTPGCRATFDIGTLRVRVPMVEHSRALRTGLPNAQVTSGYYHGSYVVTTADRVRGAPVTVMLESAGGRATAPAPGVAITLAAR